MTILLPSVQNVLDRLYWKDFAQLGRGSDIYYEYINALDAIATSIVKTFANKPLSWARDRATIVKVHNLWFLYSKLADGTIIVEEVHDANTNQILTETNPRRIIKESQLRRIIREAIRKIIT